MHTQVHMHTHTRFICKRKRVRSRFPSFVVSNVSMAKLFDHCLKNLVVLRKTLSSIDIFPIGSVSISHGKNTASSIHCMEFFIPSLHPYLNTSSFVHCDGKSSCKFTSKVSSSIFLNYNAFSRLHALYMSISSKGVR